MSDEGGEYRTYLAESPVMGQVVEVPETDLIAAVMDLRKGQHWPVSRQRVQGWREEVEAAAYGGGDLHRFAARVAQKYLDRAE